VNFYNEIDLKSAAWLRELIAQGLIPAGDVDTRSIAEIQPHELTKYTQCHFFAGIGGWSLALSLAGWPADRPVGTGSCPCQPFSAAGKGLAQADPRHLWPVFFALINACRQLGQQWAFTLFGEQVASKAGLGWLDGVCADLEGAGYAVGTADLCAACASPEVTGWLWIPDEIDAAGGLWVPVSSGPPHIRQRLYWVANAGHEPARRAAITREAEGGRALSDIAGRGKCGGLSDALRERQPGPGWMVRQGDSAASEDRQEHRAFDVGGGRWSYFDLIPCADGKTRRIESGTPALAHGISARVVRLRGYGNAIVPQVAAEFIKTCMELIP